MKIRSDILRTYQSIHTWTGITAGLLLFIGFFAGSITMFRVVIDDWATPKQHTQAQIPFAQLEAAVPKVLAEYPASQKELLIQLSQTSTPLTWYSQGSGRGTRLDDQVVVATVNSEGQIVTQDAPVNELGSLVDMLHRTGGILGDIAGHHILGEFVLGFAAFLYFVALVSGVIFLLPTLTKSFFALRTNKGANRFWLDSHNLVGIASLPFHIIIALTVVVFAFHDFLYGGLSQVYGDKEMFPFDPPSKVEYKVEQLPSLSTIIGVAKDYAPGFEVSEVRLSGIGTPRASAAIGLVSHEELMRGPNHDFLFMNPYTLEISTSSVINGDQGIWGRAVTSFFALHFGSYGGDYGRWLYFVMGLAGAFLFYSGNLLWLEKRRQKQGKQTKSVRVMASLTIGVCLGSLLGVISCFAATKWLTVTSININAAYMWIYYGVLFAAIALSFYIGAAKAAIYLLKMSVAACVFIPLTSLIALVVPAIGVWPAEGLSQITLELFALVAAFCYFKAAKRAEQRAYYGEENSIWYIGNSSKQIATGEYVKSV